VEIRERAWFFGEDKSYRDVQNTIFLSLDLESESWENLVQSRAEMDGQIRLTYDLNKGLRGGSRIALAFTERGGDLALTRSSLKVPRSYLPMGLVRLFSRLVDLTKPGTYAFSAYDVESRELVVRVLRVVGPTKAAGLRDSGPVFKIEDHVGLLPPATEVYADATGRILKVVHGDLVMRASSRTEVETIFKRQMADADGLYRRSLAEQEEAIRRLNALESGKTPPARQPRRGAPK
jgi:hypothetical protein